MYFKYSDESEYEDSGTPPAKEQIAFVKKIEFADGGILALVFNNGSTCDGYKFIGDDDRIYDDYESTFDDRIYLNGKDDYEITYGYNILIESTNRYLHIIHEDEPESYELDKKLLDRFQQLYNIMSLGTSVK